MKIIISRKGFDSTAGGAPSPIVGGVPISMPIPASKNSATSYCDLGLGEIVGSITAGRISGSALRHHDPLFSDGECIFGQTGSAQSHLARLGVGPGDLFLFFGLFRDEESGERHHCFFGYLEVQSATKVAKLADDEREGLRRLKHPHVMGTWSDRDMIYRGKGEAAKYAHPELRLTRTGGPLSQSTVPPWLQSLGITYHGKPWRWRTQSEIMHTKR